MSDYQQPSQPPYGDQSPYAHSPYAQSPHARSPYEQSPYDQPYIGPNYTSGVDPALVAALANPLHRLRARIIDDLIVGSAVFIMWVILGIIVLSLTGGPSRSETYAGTPLDTALDVIVFLVAAGMFVGYEWFFLARREGQTIGKRRMNIRVVSLTDDGQLTGRQAGVRIAAGILMRPFAFVMLFNVLRPLWNQPYRQCLHDKIAKTVVVRV